MRRALASWLIENCEVNERIIFLTGDLGFGLFDDFKKRFPSRYINCGIAESNMVAVASGLAAKGFTPIVYSIASFMTSRPYEFTKILAGYNGFPCILIGAGAGLTYSRSGATHHALDDLGLMGSIPNVELYLPAGPLELKRLLSIASVKRQTAYFRLGKFDEVDIVDPTESLSVSPILISSGSKIALLSHSNTSQIARETRSLVAQETGIDIAHYHFPFLGSIDEDYIRNEFDRFELLIVVEEHWPTGGLFPRLLELDITKECNVRIERFGPSHSFIENHLDHSSLQQLLGYGSTSLSKWIIRLL